VPAGRSQHAEQQRSARGSHRTRTRTRTCTSAPAVPQAAAGAPLLSQLLFATGRTTLSRKRPHHNDGARSGRSFSSSVAGRKRTGAAVRSPIPCIGSMHARLPPILCGPAESSVTGKHGRP